MSSVLFGGRSEGRMACSTLVLFRTILQCLLLRRRNYMHWKFLFYCTLLQISLCRATASYEWEWEPGLSFRTWYTLTFSVLYFPPSPLSMIHCFLGPFPLHPIDGFQSYLNFQVLTCCGDGQGSAWALLWIEQGHRGEKKEAGGAFIRMYCFTFSIHHRGDDSILVKIHWTPIKSDGCYHWRLKSCQGIISTNVGPQDGGLWPNDGLPGIFLVFLAFKILSSHFDLSSFSAVLARDKIWLRNLEWTGYRQFKSSLETPWSVSLATLWSLLWI